MKVRNNTQKYDLWLASLTAAICLGILLDATGILALIGVGIVIGLAIGVALKG